jgi:hypothetical protein
MRTLVFVMATAACGGGNSVGIKIVDAPIKSGCLSSNECPTGYTCNEFGVCIAPTPGVDASTPPETEVELGTPVSSQRYVYVPMTSENKLARIDGLTLAVTTTMVGQSPRVVAAIPNSDGAVVLDQANGTATIVRPAPTGDVLDVLPTLQNLNALDIDPSGRFGVAWFDLAKAVQGGGLGGVGSFQDLTIVALAPGGEKAVNLTVGFVPRNVQFDATGDHAYVVTQDGVSVIDLANAVASPPTSVPPIAVAAPGVPVSDLEVLIVSTGDFAVVRQAGVAALRVVSLRAVDAGTVFTVPLASSASDIDLAPDGSRVYAVERDAALLAVVDIPADVIDPTGVQTVNLSSGTLGSIEVSKDGTRALLFTNATHDERLTMVRLDQAGFPAVTWPLRKAVFAVAISPTSTSAIVVGAKAPGDPSTATSLDQFIDESYGYSLVDLGTGFATLQLTDVDPGSLAYAPSGSKAYVSLDGGDDPTATRAVQIVDVQSGVITTSVLGSPPSDVGILPAANVAFVSQRHPLGRISFFALVTDAVRTVTGFDLNSQVVP